jgi:tetratricopeptide (TPR) repeat protein
VGAEHFCIQILADNASHFDALHMLGSCRAQQGRYPEALELLGNALKANRNSAAALSNYANVLGTMGRWEESLDFYNRSLKQTPGNAVALNYRGIALRQLGRLEDAVRSYDMALGARPNYAVALNNRGTALHDLERFEESLASYDASLALDPRNAGTWNNRGLTLLKVGQLSEALASFDTALTARPRHAETLTNRGVALRELSRHEEALTSLNQAISADPNYANGWWNKAIILLLNGNFEEGWQLYEWRKKRSPPVEARSYSQPLWTGAQDIKGKTLFLYVEQGLGDTIQFYRFVIVLIAAGARIILSAPDRLLRLLEDANLPVELIGANTVPQHFDYHVPLMSLPLALGTGGDLLASTVPYLRAQPERVSQWAARIGGHGRKIGIAWQGATIGMRDRSIPLACFEMLSTVADVRLISLQKDIGTEQLASAGMSVETLGVEFDNGPDAFIDTAAVIENLDLVISLDSAVAHLAGALGRPVWVALKKVPDWRWLQNRADSPWYPTMRLFRQEFAGDWDKVFVTMRESLKP